MAHKRLGPWRRPPSPRARYGFGERGLWRTARGAADRQRVLDYATLATAAGTAETEAQVENVVLRIHPAPEPPHGATADFDLVHLSGEREVRRERWSGALRFEFLESVPPELVVHNPMGLLITFLQADRALVTEDDR